MTLPATCATVTNAVRRVNGTCQLSWTLTGETSRAERECKARGADWPPIRPSRESRRGSPTPSTTRAVIDHGNAMNGWVPMRRQVVR